MKNCPFCREEIRDDAIKCRHCKTLLVSFHEAKPEVDEKRVTYVVDRDLVRFGKFAVAVLAVFVVVGTYLFGFRLENALDKVGNVEKSLGEAEYDIRISADESKAKFQSALQELQTERKSVSELKKEVASIFNEATRLLASISGHEREANEIVLLISKRLNPEQRERLAVARNERGDKFRDDTVEASTLKLWKNGSTIRIRFLNGEETTKETVKSIANEWTRYANVTFDFTDSQSADVRIGFDGESSWSFQGTDCLGIPPDEPTMNLVSPNLSGSEKTRFGAEVLHEFGHMLGLIHEFLNPNATIPWNRPAVYNELGSSNLWTKQQIDWLWFDRLTPGELPNYRDFDPTSIMMYAIPNRWTLGDFEVEPPQKLSESDKTLISKLYPK